MSAEIIVGLLAMAGTIVGSLLGILAANKLVMYRIEQLEKKVEKHNSVIERLALCEQNQKTMWHKIDELKERGE